MSDNVILAFLCLPVILVALCPVALFIGAAIEMSQGHTCANVPNQWEDPEW